MMRETGPPIQWLTQRIAMTPEAFLKKPLLKGPFGTQGIIHTAAVVSDLIFDVANIFPNSEELKIFFPSQDAKNENFLRLVLISTHLFHDPFFHNQPHFANLILSFLQQQLHPLSNLLSAEVFISDPDRREELARRCLNALNLVAQGESEVVFQDRLITLDSIEREKLIQQTRAAQERARQLREEMARREAEEAASKMSRE